MYYYYYYNKSQILNIKAFFCISREETVISDGVPQTGEGEVMKLAILDLVSLWLGLFPGIVLHACMHGR